MHAAKQEKNLLAHNQHGVWCAWQHLLVLSGALSCSAFISSFRCVYWLHVHSHLQQSLVCNNGDLLSKECQCKNVDGVADDVGNHEYDYHTGNEKHKHHHHADPSGADHPYDPDWGNYGEHICFFGGSCMRDPNCSNIAKTVRPCPLIPPPKPLPTSCHCCFAALRYELSFNAALSFYLSVQKCKPDCCAAHGH